MPHKRRSSAQLKKIAARLFKGKLPKRTDEELLIHAHDRTLIIKKINRDFFARVEGETRARFGNAQQIGEDIGEFLENGALPRSKGGWT